MVIQTLKAQIASLTEAMKEKGVPEKVMTTLKESASKLQGLLDKAREAAKEAKEEGYEEEAGEPMAGEEDGAGHIDPHKLPAGHKMKKTVTVEHTGGEEKEESGDEPEPKDDGDEKDEKDAAEESRKVHLELLLKEAGIPKEICSPEKLAGKSLKEAKEIIAEKKAEIELVRKAVEGNLEFVPTGSGADLHESTGGETLNSLFTGCAE